MKKNVLIIFIQVMLLNCLIAQDNVEVEPYKGSHKHFAIYTNIISGGYTRWTTKYAFGNDEYRLFGNGLNTGPSLALYYILGKRAKLGVNGIYLFNFINTVEPENGLSKDVIRQDNNNRGLLTLAGSVQFSLITSNSFDLITSLDGGTFWIKRDDFNEQTKDRYFGSLGLIFEFKLSPGFSLLLSPDYLLYKYELANGLSDRKSYIHNFNGNLGVAFKL